MILFKEVEMSSSGTEEPPSGKRPKLNPDQSNPESHCQHFVQRKKRFCKMTVARGKSYCGEHDVHASENADRIPCPLDPKHSVSAAKLEKHLKICNAKEADRPPFIEPGVNALSDYEDDQEDVAAGLKLADVPDGELKTAIERILKLYDESRIGMIDELLKEHPAFKEELANESYGPQTLKHLVQSASLLGIIEHEGFLQNETAFVEFGAGKGQVAFWLATILQQSALTNTKVLLVDRASHRHKKDNKIEDRELIQRVRADIADLVLNKLELGAIRSVVGVGKHLCGGATDLALRCLIHANRQSRGFVFALCCHHRCDWATYTGKRFLLEAGLGRRDFELMVRMVSWAVCGTGTSRERRKDVVGGDDGTAVKYGLTRAQREDIGRKCKRVLDAGRIRYLERNGFEAGLKFYAASEVTLENVCMIGHVRNKV